MGIFGSRKKTYVTSVAYNLAGDEKNRANYLKTTVIGSILAERPSLAGSINQSYLGGPGIRFRNYQRWAENQGYVDGIGWTYGSLHAGDSLDNTILANYIPSPSGEEVAIQSAIIDVADYTYWADQYISENFPDRLSTEYTVDMDESANTITITWEDGSTTTFTPTNFNSDFQYLYVTYILVSEGSEGEVVPGADVSLGSDPLPSISDWTQNSYTSSNETVTLTTKTTVDVTYSDSTPAEHSTNTTTEDQSYVKFTGVYERTTYKGIVPGEEATYSIREIMYQNQDGKVTQETTTNTVEEDIGGGVIKTAVTTVMTDVFAMDRSYRIDTQEIIHKSWSPLKIFIYRMNSGIDDLDAMFAIPQDGGAFYPFIPMRINNKFIGPDKNQWDISYLGNDATEEEIDDAFKAVQALHPVKTLPVNYPELYALTKKATRKSLASKYDKLATSLAKNPSLKDIDYAYIVFGVSLNVKELACRKYIYRFFQAIMEDYNNTPTGAYAAWKAQWDAAEASRQAWKEWRERQNATNPDPSDTEPTRLSYPTMPTNSLNIATSDATKLNYNITLYWNYIDESTGTGLLKEGAKRGDLWFDVGASEEFTEMLWVSGSMIAGHKIVNDSITLSWQVTATTWRRLTIVGLKHKNLIYRGKAVEISAKEALEDADESGFIIPMHDDVYRSMGLKDGTQMSQACSFMLLNCYKVVKKKWYQTGLFKVVLVVVIIAVSIYTAGTGAGASAGLLGTNGAVGFAITGLAATSMTAIIVGAVANAIAAMILVSIIQRGAVALFGEKWGAVIGAIAGFVAVKVGSSYMSNQSMSSAFSGMMRAENILKLTDAVGQGYTGYLQASIAEITAQTQDILEEYQKVSKEIQEKYAEQIGYGLANSSEILTSVLEVGNESAASFLQRTLMTGTDVAQMSLDLLANFAEITTSTNLETI